MFHRTWKDKPSPGLIPMQFGFEDDGKVKREFASFEECYNEELSKRAPGGSDMYMAGLANYKK